MTHSDAGSSMNKNYTRRQRLRRLQYSRLELSDHNPSCVVHCDNVCQTLKSLLAFSVLSNAYENFLFCDKICTFRLPLLLLLLIITSGYATWFTAGGAIRIAHYDVIGDVITRKV